MKEITMIMWMLLFAGLVLAQDDEEKIAQLVKDLGADSLEVREKAMHQLIGLGNRAKKFVEEVKDHSDPEVRWRARQILEVIPVRERLGDSLWEKLPDKVIELAIASDAYKRLQILKDMASIEDKDKRPTDKELVTIVEEILRGVTKKGVKLSVIRFVVDNGLESVGEVLAKLLQDKDYHVRSNATWALGRLSAKEYAKDIAKLLKDKNSRVRLAAARALGQLSARSALEPLKRQLKREKDFWVHREIEKVIKKIESAEEK
jgi:HEAT repeat protein